MDIPTAIVDVKILSRGIVANRICVLEQRDPIEQFVVTAIVDFEAAVSAISHIEAVVILAIPHGMRSFNAFDPLKQLSLCEIEYKHRFGVFRRREQPVPLEVNAEMIEVPFDIGRNCQSLNQAQRRTLSLG